jgi:hypothetical protein
VDRSPELAKLTDGEHVLLVEPGNLYAEGVAHAQVEGAYRWWYGVIESRATIHTLAPDQATPDEPERIHDLRRSIGGSMAPFAGAPLPSDLREPF